MKYVAKANTGNLIKLALNNSNHFLYTPLVSGIADNTKAIGDTPTKNHK